MFNRRGKPIEKKKGACRANGGKRSAGKSPKKKGNPKVSFFEEKRIDRKNLTQSISGAKTPPTRKLKSKNKFPKGMKREMMS